MMLPLRLSLVTLALCLISTVIDAKQKVTIYSDQGYPPYSFVEDGKPQGIYTEILKRAFSRMENYDVTIKPVPWKRGLKFIEDGSGFALYPPYMHIEKRSYMWPYSIPIIYERTSVFCHEGVLANTLRPRWPEDYYGLVIGNNSSFEVGGSKFWQAVQKGFIKVDEVAGNRQNILKLGLKRIDCYMNDRLSILWELKRLKASGEYQEGGRHARLIEGAAISVEQGFLGFTDKDKGKYPFKTDFVKKIDTILYDMIRNGETQKIIDDYVR